MVEISDRIRNIPKSGIREIFDRAQELGAVINFGIGEPNFLTPDFIRSAGKAAINSGFVKYTTNAGLPELRKEIAHKLKKENRIECDPKTEIIVTAGATQAIFSFLNCVLNPGDEVLIPTPAFTAYRYATLLAGGVPIEVPSFEEEGYRPDFGKLEGLCTKRTKLLILNSPCNPTGSVLQYEDVQRACELAARRDLFLLSDEIYEKYLYDGAKHYSPGSFSEYRNRVITINGFSKTWAMTGWRLGYAAANPDIITAMTRYNMYNAVCADSISQMAGIAAMRHSMTFFKQILKEFDARRKQVCEHLDELGWDYTRPRGTFYIFPKLPQKFANSLLFARELLEKSRVAIIPGSSFGKSGEGHVGNWNGKNQKIHCSRVVTKS
jgi:aminotransferase